MIKNICVNKAQVTMFVILSVFVISSGAWATTYYVDATNGNDANTGTSTDQAWKTISKVESAPDGGYQLGDIVKFKRGEIWDVSSNRFDVPASNLTISAYGAGDLPILDAGFSGYAVVIPNNKDNVTVEYVQAQKASTNAWAITAWGCSNPTIRYCTVLKGGTGVGGGGIKIWSDVSGASVHDNTIGKDTGNPDTDREWSGFVAIRAAGNGGSIYNNTINHTTTESRNESLKSFYSHGVRLESISGAWEIYENTIYHVGTHGIYFSQENGSSFALNIYGNNISYPGNAGISLWRVHDNNGTTNIYRNEVSYCDRLAPQEGNSANGIHLNNSGSSNFDTVNVYENVVRDCQSPYSPNNEDSGGLAIDYRADGVYVYLNVFYDNWGKGIYIYNASNCKVFNNIAWGNDAGITVSTTGEGERAGDNEIYGNVFYKNNNGSYGPGYDCEILFGLRDTGTIIMNNILYADDSGVAFHYYDVSTSGHHLENNIVYKETNLSSICRDGGGGTSWSNWISGHSGDLYAGGPGDVNDNPDFTDPANHSFALLPGSPAIDAGTNLGSPYELAIDPITKLRDWPHSVAILNQDQHGIGFEIGAFVYNDNGDSAPPSPPSGLTIINSN